MKVLVLSPENKNERARKRRRLIVRALEGLRVKLLNPLPGRPPKKKEFNLLEKADLVIADLTELDFKMGFLISKALVVKKPVLGLFWESIKKEKVEKWQESEFLFTECFNRENIRLIIRRFLKFISQRRRSHGKLIVIDGTDGSGKATQAKLLIKYLKKRDLRFKYIDFPRYYSSFHGGVVGRYLKGEFGGLSKVNPYLVSLTYALDRLTAKEELENWLRGGNIVVANRYTSSNMAHQTARVKAKEREKFLRWLAEMEYKVHRLPKEDLVIFLHVPVEIGQKLVDKKGKRGYVGGSRRDIQEKSLEHLKKAEKMYLYLTKKFNHWVKIECLDKQGKLYSLQRIHQKITDVLCQKGIVPKSSLDRNIEE